MIFTAYISFISFLFTYMHINKDYYPNDFPRPFIIDFEVYLIPHSVIFQICKSCTFALAVQSSAIIQSFHVNYSQQIIIVINFIIFGDDTLFL